jgi:hypothetical protein
MPVMHAVVSAQVLFDFSVECDYKQRFQDADHVISHRTELALARLSRVEMLSAAQLECRSK